MIINMMDRALPELLSPAGSPEALEAALAAGADAVYLGGSHFNARMNAHNFDEGELREAVTHAHRMGGRVYLTLNTLLWDRELSDALRAAYAAALAGVDALIIADLGAAALIRRSLPRLPLHASTQLSGHNARVGEVLAPFGFSRFVIARETSFRDLAVAVRENPLEVEVFVHGALCVSHSGQCLFSSLVGGRSGNRGECAQPCRLPCRCERSAMGRNTNRRAPHPEDGYPLSLKDLSLAAHVPALIEAGVASLKIEGRMKSAGYVSGVTAMWRRLLDERRAATEEELAWLSELFSRDGFTDGYQTEHIDSRMMGVRRETDKERTAAAEREALSVRHQPHLPLAMTLTVRENEPVTLIAEAPLYRQAGTDSDRMVATVTVTGDPPLRSDGQALSREVAEKQLSRTGGTPYRLTEFCLDMVDTADEQGLSLPLSRLNALRREVVEALDAARATALPDPIADHTPLSDTDLRALMREIAGVGTAPVRVCHSTARFRTPEQITPDAVDGFDLLYLPLGILFPDSVSPEKQGCILPPVIFDRDAADAADAAVAALDRGIRHFLVGNYGHLTLVREAADRARCAVGEIVLHGDFRLGVTNSLSFARALGLGFSDVILSPELTIPRMRDIGRGAVAVGHPHAASAIVYGRLPMMLLEKCAIRELYRGRTPDEVCRDICRTDAAVLRDRMGKDFPILREAFPRGKGHRNVVYNSLPLSMSDRPAELAQAALATEHFLFSTETPGEVDAVIRAYRRHTALPGEVRRMVK